MRYFFIFTQGPSAEDYSALYTTLVIANSEQEAIEKYCAREANLGYTITPDDFDDLKSKYDEAKYGIRERIPII